MDGDPCATGTFHGLVARGGRPLHLELRAWYSGHHDTVGGRRPCQRPKMPRFLLSGLDRKDSCTSPAPGGRGGLTSQVPNSCAALPELDEEQLSLEW
jgi:hypothetical protein